LGQVRHVPFVISRFCLAKVDPSFQSNLTVTFPLSLETKEAIALVLLPLHCKTFCAKVKSEKLIESINMNTILYMVGKIYEMKLPTLYRIFGILRSFEKTIFPNDRAKMPAFQVTFSVNLVAFSVKMRGGEMENTPAGDFRTVMRCMTRGTRYFFSGNSPAENKLPCIGYNIRLQLPRKYCKSVMNFDRKAYRHLLDWKNNPGRKPLIVRGTRQVGKSTLIQQFSKEFRHFIPLNMEKNAHHRFFENQSIDFVCTRYQYCPHRYSANCTGVSGET